MIRNLSQLKKQLRKGTEFVITDHCLSEYIGQRRQVTLSNTQGFYSIVPGEPEHKVSLANNGRGSVLWWSKAPFWQFKDGICGLYNSDTQRTGKYLIVAFRVLDKEAA
ncbi:hypothetical protein [Caproicibacter sp. BJN0012]|uniref:hypothetical protein n=1 Tax=Caproicibacter sp. BJN0012 TaxID=3110227 RepID=UPI002E13881D